MSAKVETEEFKVFGYDLEFNRFGVISIVLVIVACMGGIVQSSGASTLQLIMTVFPTMLVLSLILAVQPMKYIWYAGVLVTILDIGIILYNIL